MHNIAQTSDERGQDKSMNGTKLKMMSRRRFCATTIQSPGNRIQKWLSINERRVCT
ncbi:hypothetical protein P170DRAFT_431969 [Aspergillus steynii IBT 23096]|uniref:Uncharacterized protein n=1 Tax=Aspergillus steynii IBT 23096 TaxID=1392250 RepID=A0A2I2GN75_9EURO|nr:uncharacterized protein P170DRAFT_431969 [Aspergillus steynii IBT 23096]PLB54338.1 hypothetical protein P170DRAFT_431969 [Aspergillus steynii IBT 23096]